MTEPTTSTGRRLAALRPIVPSPRTASPSPPKERSPVRPSRLQRLPTSSRRVLDFDLETVAAGFADPEWVPQTITAWAYAWVSEREPTQNPGLLPDRSPRVEESVDSDNPRVEVGTLAVADFYNLEARRQFLEPLVSAIRQADVVTGHNILRFDLPVLNADVMRVGLPTLDPVLAQDTIRLPRTKGFKKGQDVLSGLLGVEAEKLPLNWWEWAQGYADDDHQAIRDRVAGDVIQHMQLRDRMREKGWLMSPRMWRP